MRARKRRHSLDVSRILQEILQENKSESLVKHAYSVTAPGWVWFNVKPDNTRAVIAKRLRLTRVILQTAAPRHRLSCSINLMQLAYSPHIYGSLNYL